MNPIANWLNKEFQKWERKTGERQTYKAFAEYLGVKYTTFSSWLNQGARPGNDNLRKIANRLGEEIYIILGEEPPSPSIALDHFPLEFRGRLEQAADEVEREFERHKITGDSPEAERIVIKIFEKYGFKYTDTEDK